MKTEITQKTIQQKVSYPCVMERECELKEQELIVIFVNHTTGTIIHQRGTGWQIGLQVNNFDCNDIKWRPFIGSIKFS